MHATDTWSTSSGIRIDLMPEDAQNGVQESFPIEAQSGGAATGKPHHGPIVEVHGIARTLIHV